MSERPWTDQMRALVRLLGLMRREGRAGGKAVQLAMQWLRENQGVDPDAELARVMILSLCVVAGDADRQMERDLEERRCSEEVRYGQDQQQAQGQAGRA